MSSLVTYPFYLFITYLFETRSCCFYRFPSEQAPRLHLFLPSQYWGYKHMLLGWLSHEVGDLNLGPHACAASILPSPVTWKYTFTFMKHKVFKPNYMGVKDHVVLINENIWGDRNRDAERLERDQQSESGQVFLNSQHLIQEWNRSPHRLQSMRELWFRQSSSDQGKEDTVKNDRVYMSEHT